MAIETDPNRRSTGGATSLKERYDDDGGNKGKIGLFIAVLAIIAALVVAGFFFLGGDADVDVDGGNVDISVPTVDADVDAPDINVDTPEVDIETPDVSIDPGSIDSEGDLDITVEEGDANANAGS